MSATRPSIPFSSGADGAPQEPQAGLPPAAMTKQETTLPGIAARGDSATSSVFVLDPSLRVGGPDFGAAADWYDAHADQFSAQSLSCSVPTEMTMFLKGLPGDARILDAGCGAGRDLAAFLSSGFRPAGFDASAAMCAAARTTTQQACPIRHLTFQDFADPPGSWDAIWCIASLLHVAPNQIDDVLTRLTRSLAPGGRIFVSVKTGKGASLDDRGRPMAYWTPGDLARRLAGALPETGRVFDWTSDAPSSGNTLTTWTNVYGLRGDRPQ